MSPSGLAAYAVMAPTRALDSGDHRGRRAFGSGSRGALNAAALYTPSRMTRGAYPGRVDSRAMPEDLRTTAVVQMFLNDLKGDSPAEPIVRELLAHAAARLRLLCASMLSRDYPRLARPPLNLQPDEMLSGVVERLLKAMQKTRPPTVRQFFALANQHMRWELNDLARRLDERSQAVELRDEFVPAPESSGSG